MEIEQWLAVVNFPGYEVSNLGRVRAWRNTRGRPLLVPRILKNSVQDPGYCIVQLRKDNKSYKRFVHRLVLEAFVGPCPPGQVARHYPDNDRTNCRLSNLRWGTAAENEQDKKDIGIYPLGERHYATHLTNEDVVAIRKRSAAGERQCDLANEYGLGRPAVSAICRGKTWRHLIGGQ